MEIKTLVAKAHENAVKHGFWEPPLPFGTAIALIHSELSEALEEERNGNPDVWFACNESDNFICTPQDETECLMYGKESLCKYRSRKPEGVAVELADAVIRIADLCGHLGIDLEEVIEIKMAYNEGRPYKHGKKILIPKGGNTMNQCQLMGRLVRDPELKYTPQGTAVTSFTLAVDRRFNRDKADYINIIAWRQTAEFVAKHFAKGQRVAVVGSIQTRSWEDNDGGKHKAVQIVADSVYFADAKKESAAGSYAESAMTSEGFEVTDEDIPF